MLVTTGTLCDIVKQYNRKDIDVLNEKDKTDEKIINDEKSVLIKKNQHDGMTVFEHDDFERLFLTCFPNLIGPMAIKLLLAFSAYSNAKKVFHIAKSRGDQLQCIHAIRTLSFAWVVLGHTFVYGLPIISE